MTTAPCGCTFKRPGTLVNVLVKRGVDLISYIRFGFRGNKFPPGAIETRIRVCDKHEDGTLKICYF